jgi:hypothetical protein
MVKCEGDVVRGFVAKKDSNPKWNTSAVFYRYKQTKPVKIEVLYICFILNMNPSIN